MWHIHKWFSVYHFGSVVSVRVTRAKSLEVLSRGFAARDFGLRPIPKYPPTSEKTNPLVPWVVTDKLANHFASFSYQISEELRQILTSVPQARTNEGLKKVKTPVKNCVVLIAITT